MKPTWRDRRDQASRRWFYGLFFLLPLLAVFGHRGIAPWLLLASLPAFFRGDFWQAAFGKLFDHPSLKDPVFAGFAAILFFCFWILLSGLWSPKHHYSLFLWVLAPSLVGGSIVWFSLNLSREWAWRLGAAFSLAIAGGMIILSFEGVTGGMLRGLVPPRDISPDGSRDIVALGRGVTALAPALFPAAAIAVRVWSLPSAIGIFALGVVAAATNDVTANVLAIGAGLAAALLSLQHQRLMFRLAGWGAIAALLLFPLAAAFLPVDAIYDYASENLSEDQLAALSSSLHRLAVWKSVSMELLQGLPAGFGADYARIWKETAPLISVPGSSEPLSVMPTHPHNIFLQTWLELGLAGVASLALFIYFGFQILVKSTLSKAVGAASVGAFAAIMVSVTVEGSMWQVWRLAAMALAASGVALAHALERR